MSRDDCDLVAGGVQDELRPHAVVLWAAVVEQGVGQVRHPFSAQRLPAREEHRILARGEGETQARVYKYTTLWMINVD